MKRGTVAFPILLKATTATAAAEATQKSLIG